MYRRHLGLGAVLLTALLVGGATPVHLQAGGKGKVAHIKVLLPDEDATLTIDSAETKMRGVERRFVSPPLEPGKRFYYTLVAFWEPNNYTKIWRTRKVLVMAGQTTTVDMRD